MIKISAYIVTLNEELRLDRTLKAVSKVADEIIIVDSGSTDKTEKIAKKHKAKFIFHKWKNISSQKNFAQNKCSNDWVLSLDSDEVLSDDLIQEIKQIKKNPTADAYKVKICESDTRNEKETNFINTYLFHVDGTQESAMFGILGKAHVISESPEEGLSRLCLEIRDRLNKGPVKLKYDAIVNSVKDFFEGHPDSRKFFKKPIAFTFNKIDLILKNQELFRDSSISNMTWENNSSFLDGSGVNISEMDSISNGIKSALCECWGESNFVVSMESFYKNLKFFGVSGLGEDPALDKKITNLRPYRVLDPLVWILNEFNYSLPIYK